MSKLIRHWRQFANRGGVLVHDLDKDGLATEIGCYEPRVVGSFINRRSFRSDKSNIFEFSLVPQPFCGNINTARVYILLLNPGISYTDVYGEQCSRRLRARLRMNLRQSFRGEKFPFIWLDPNLCWHAGFIWWEQRLRSLAQAVEKAKYKGRADGYELALRFVARRIASIELVPYHAGHIRLTRRLRSIESVKLAKKFVQERVATRADAGECIVLIFRQENEWGLKGHTGVKKGNPRSVRFSRFQKEMLRALDA